jgi:NADH-quinone oxidoreductase subunit N
LIAYFTSLAGIPPTVGFYAKLSVLQSVVVSGQVGLAVAAVMLSLVGAFYYLRVVKVMYFDAPKQSTPVPARGGVGALLALNGAAGLVLGLLPDGLMGLCRDVIVAALAG